VTATVSPAPPIDATAERGFDQFRRLGESSSGFLVFNREMEHFQASERDALIAYRRIGRRHLVQLCGPFAAAADQGPAIDEFLAFAAAEKRRVTAVQLRVDDARAYARRGFSVNQLGSSFSIELDRFTLRGKAFVKVRNKVSRARRAGVVVTELRDEGEAPALAEIDKEWLRQKGRLVHELAFLVGQRGGRGAPFRRVFLASCEGRPLAYLTYAPVYGSERPGWLYDLTRRRADTPPGTIELLFTTALEKVRGEGAKWLHLGLTPLVGLDTEVTPDLADARNPTIARVFRALRARGSAVYPAATQEAFKLKWGPTVIEPEFVAFQRGPSLGAFVGLLRLTKSIPW
jgi:lysylphosphatidylglycerol synthetase-like protein (DUF2156 family)